MSGSAGGCKVADPHFHGVLDWMRAYNPSDNDSPERASRPHSHDRAGFIFAEGAGGVVLESRAAAEARGAQSSAVLKGFGMSSDGAGQTLAPSAEGALQAMRNALGNAGVRGSSADYINTHGTSTVQVDVTEVSAIRGCLDARYVSYSSTNGCTGHTVTAAGEMEPRRMGPVRRVRNS